MMGRLSLYGVLMSGLQMRRYLFLGVLFLMGQLFSVAHAAEFGDHSHSHDEITWPTLVGNHITKGCGNNVGVERPIRV